MRHPFLKVLAAIPAMLLFVMCEKDPGGPYPFPEGGQLGADWDEIIAEYDTTITVDVLPFDMGYGMAIDPVSEDFDIHLDVISLYAYGDNDYSGDYYAVSGYLVAHNAGLGIHSGSIAHTVTYGQETRILTRNYLSTYLGEMSVKCRLLDDQGRPMKTDDAHFFVSPEPSTSIQKTTYYSGFSFSLEFGVSFGRKPAGKFIIPYILPDFSFSNKSTQELPDRTVELNTDYDTRNIDYGFLYQNGDTFDDEAIPSIFKTDDKMEFSWGWHVYKGKVNSVDDGLKGMKLSIEIDPGYMTNVEYFDSMEPISGHVIDYGLSVKKSSDVSDRTWVIDLPQLDRTPKGDFSFRNQSTSYLDQIVFYNADETASLPVDNFHLEPSQTYETMLPAGEYEMQYRLIKGDGTIVGNYKVSDIVIVKDQRTSSSTRNARRL